MQQLQIALMIAVSGALGALARYGVVLLATNVWGSRFPFGTLLVNVSGCLVMGIAAAALPENENQHSSSLIKYAVMIGFLGAFTTFSAFSLETLRQLQSGNGLLAATNVLANIAMCLVAVWIGQRAGALLL